MSKRVPGSVLEPPRSAASANAAAPRPAAGDRLSIRVEELEKRYEDLVALAGLSLSIAEGGIVGLLGPNGAGKTTLVEILEGLRAPTSGRVSVLGLDPVRDARRVRDRIGVQLQSTAIPLDLKAREVIDMFRAFHSDPRPADEVLARVGLERKAGARVRHMSGGQRQRLAIGMALVHDPELLILDEPTTGLDPVARRAIHDIVRDYRAPGRTVILTTHYIEEAEQLCDRVLMMRSGRIVADGAPLELVAASEGYSTLFATLSGPCDDAPLRAAGAVPQAANGPHRRWTTRDPAAAIVALGEMVRSQELTLEDLHLKRPTLEDVYLERVGALEPDGPGGDA